MVLQASQPRGGRESTPPQTPTPHPIDLEALAAALDDAAALSVPGALQCLDLAFHRAADAIFWRRGAIDHRIEGSIEAAQDCEGRSEKSLEDAGKAFDRYLAGGVG